jgi:hypothetical protein
MKMKRITSLLVTASILMAGSLFAGFMFFDQQKDASKTQVEDAQNSLKSVQKNADRIAERKAINDELKTFKLESELKIKNNEVRIAELKLKLNKQGSVLDEASAKKIDSFSVYFSTDIEMEATEIFEIYQTRFQIEFVYRDDKQHTSLTTCQARNKEKLDFHFNMSLTTVNVAKIIRWCSIPIQERKSFSLSDIKIINHNTLLLERFIEMFAIKPYLLKNNQNVKELLLYGTIAA